MRAAPPALSIVFGASPPKGRPRYLPALDSLRFFAALFVAGGHYAGAYREQPLSEGLMSLTGLGMTLFFVLSGFVIHYNYHEVLKQPGGLKLFLVARFARLYPLFILLFVLEFAYVFATRSGACGHEGLRGGLLLAIPYYVTFTQSWFYGTICKASLIYQYGPISAVTWSLSVEAFFYVSYIALRTRLGGDDPNALRAVRLAIFTYLALIAYLLLCGAFESEIDRIGETAFGPVASSQYGYRDSLLRWLYYFNPLARVPEFIAGAAAAQAYLSHAKSQTSTIFRSGAVTAALVFAVFAVHLGLYLGVAPHNGFVGRIASLLYGPLIALLIYSLVRLPAPPPLLCHPLILALGQSSYSIYLLHEVLPSLTHRMGLYDLALAPAWVVWSASLVILLAASRVSYLTIEKPARAAIRRFAKGGSPLDMVT